jgi:hypothetical protein
VWLAVGAVGSLGVGGAAGGGAAGSAGAADPAEAGWAALAAVAGLGAAGHGRKRRGEISAGEASTRCAIRDDLTDLMVDGAADPAAMSTIVEILCGVDRPESIYTWKRSAKVQALLTGLASGEITLSHEGLDTAGRAKHISHLRSMLEHHGLLPQRDEHLARFEPG